MLKKCEIVDEEDIQRIEKRYFDIIKEKGFFKIKL
jgi:hypothetical protein